ncbi:hypothetical protein WICPIJ_008114 [Wickerhamomyces pijperi]|uniref:Mediator complex subunit 9 n=1 Tax=Wickerhamomyces pijperi TaxID=599730 RepID=A0A9P8PYN9_WICPI|nr:hypothetical protein WICPIJ_008114 [Wickerhamomyces pijperi]
MKLLFLASIFLGLYFVMDVLFYTWLPTNYVFDPVVLNSICNEVLHNHPEKNTTLIMEDVAIKLQQHYGKGLINEFDNERWFFNNAGGAMGSVYILHASISEYLIFFGSATGTEGHTGLHFADDHFTILSGHQKAGKLNDQYPEIYYPGDTHHLRKGTTKQYSIPAGGFSLELAQGWIPAMLPFGFFDTFFSTLDFVTLYRTTYFTAADMITQLLRGILKIQKLVLKRSTVSTQIIKSQIKSAQNTTSTKSTQAHMNHHRTISSPLAMANPSPLASGSSIIRLEDSMSPQAMSTGPNTTTSAVTAAATPASFTSNITSTAVNDKWCKNATSVEELRNLELVPLVLDVMEGVNSGNVLPKDVENAAGTIRVRINKARELIKNIHGLAELPEERLHRVETLNQNIDKKTNALLRLKRLVSQKIDLSEESQLADKNDEVKTEEEEQQQPSGIKDEDVLMDTN